MKYSYDEFELELGEYKIMFSVSDGLFECFRYGEPWRILVGDNLVYSLAYRILELEGKL